jgi:hypothetical protein
VLRVVAGVLALVAATVGAACGDGAGGAGANDEPTPTDSLLDPGQTGPVEAPADDAG